MSADSSLSPDQVAAQAVYDRLWQAAETAYAAGAVVIDPYLDQSNDSRRGLTLLLRPGGAALMGMCGVLDELRALVPEQHIYTADALHITVLSVISITAGIAVDDLPAAPYNAVFGPAIAALAPFDLRVTGLCAAPDSLMFVAQAQDDALNRLREVAREGLRAAGLDAYLELRYRSVTAHLTALRFRSVPARLPELLAYVRARRQIDLGAFTAGALELVSNDWYMSPQTVRVWGRYPLGGE